MEARRIKNVPDPNRSQNRVPLEAEVITLRSIRAQKQTLANTIASQLATAKEAHSRIQNRYDNLLHELEDIQSELNISNNHLNMLEAQQEMLQAEEKKLAALLHPIRRCPEDILKIVFEYAVNQSDTRIWFETATNISHVCKYWRAVALRTAFLWINIRVSVRDNIEYAKLFIERTRARTRSRPVVVEINNIGRKPVETTKSLIECLELDRFETVDAIFLYLASCEDVSHISHHTFGAALTAAKFVHIKARSQFRDPRILYCDWIIEGAPKLEGLELEGLDTVVMTERDPFQSLRYLRIQKFWTPTTMAMRLSRLPSLVELHIRGPYIMSPVTQDVNLLHLSDLKLLGVSNFCWNRVTAPRLARVETDDGSAQVISFLCGHPSIHHLIFAPSVTEEDFQRLSIHLPGIETLYMCRRVPMDGLFRKANAEDLFLSFPRLKQLDLEMDDQYGISRQDVEDFVRIRCIPSEASRRGDIALVSKLTLLGPDLEQASWRSSSLLQGCRQTFEPAIRGWMEQLDLEWTHS